MENKMQKGLNFEGENKSSIALQLDTTKAFDLINIKGIHNLLLNLEEKVKTNLYHDAVYDSIVIAKDKCSASDAMINRIGSYVGEIAMNLINKEIINENDIVSLVFTLHYRPVSLNIFDFTENEKLNEKIIAKLAKLA